MKQVTAYREGYSKKYKSIAEAARILECDESTVRKGLRLGVKTAGFYWKITEEGDEENVSDKLPREIDDELKKLGVDIENVGTVWAKQMKNGSYRYSVKFSESATTDKDALLKSFKKHASNKLEERFFPPVKPKDKILMVYTSDKHIGSKVSANSMYKNDYNEDVFHERMMKLLKHIVCLAERDGPFKDLYIIDLGDPLDGYNGQTTRGGHGLPQNLTNEEAFDVFMRTHILFFNSLVLTGVAKNIHFKATTNDNHSGSFGYTAQRALEIYLNAVYPTITTEINDKFMFHFNIGEHVFIVTHGKDKTDRMRPMPLNLNDQTKNFITDYIDYHNLSREAGYVHVIKGDMHQAASQLTSRFRYRNVLSLYGASAWIQNNFGSQTIAGVAMDIIEEDSSDIYETNLIFKR